MLTRDQFNRLKTIEKHLYSAHYNQFLSGIKSEDLNTAGFVWQEVYGRYESLNFSCNSCAMNVFSKLARIYYKHYDEYSKPIEVIPSLETVIVESSIEVNNQSNENFLDDELNSAIISNQIDVDIILNGEKIINENDQTDKKQPKETSNRIVGEKTKKRGRPKIR